MRIMGRVVVTSFMVLSTTCLPSPCVKTLARLGDAVTVTEQCLLAYLVSNDSPELTRDRAPRLDTHFIPPCSMEGRGCLLLRAIPTVALGIGYYVVTHGKRRCQYEQSIGVDTKYQAMRTGDVVRQQVQAAIARGSVAHTVGAENA
ncbi:hypothetical protein F5Y08DRAFT_305630 [Xylaria arbuscula]|nr:hypothetical protein F5Y08DRAFT_305630 [Xylaria arbuscula]